MNRCIAAMMLLMMSLVTVAQTTVKGIVVDKDTKDAVMLATVVLNGKNDKLVTGATTNENGAFTLAVKKAGDYTLKVTSVGYKALTQKVSIKKDTKELDLGTLSFEPDAVVLKEALVTGQAAKLVVKEDTFVYNAAAYHTPEGSVVEELVRRLPGAQVGDDGSITINGKTVKKIKVDGKEFMTGDTETALKNLPTAIVERVKAYDEKSDLARVTGIDDGDESTVLDFGIKRGMNRGTMINMDFGIGTKERYSERGMGGYMVDNLRVMAFGSFNNVGDRGFPGGGGGWGGGRSNGLNASKMLGLNINYQNAKILTIDGSVRWNHRDGDTWSQSSGESFRPDGSLFTNSLSQSFSRSNQWNMQMRLEWNPNEMTNILFRPSISISTNDNKSQSGSATFNADPYTVISEPLPNGHLAEDLKVDDGITVNSSESRNLTYSESNSYKATLQVNRKLSTTGRNFTVRVEGSLSDGESISSNIKDINYYLTTDPSQLTRRYSTTPTNNNSIRTQLTYSEPLGKQWFLQAMYSFRYNHQKSDRTTYSYDNIPGFSDWVPAYRQWDSFLSHVADPFAEQYYSKDLSKFSQYDTYTHDAQLTVRLNQKKLNFSAGFMVQPQHTEFKYRYMSQDINTSRDVINFSPSLDLRYKFDKVSQLRMTYRGSTSQPSMTDLLPISDNSDPLNISEGNPGLKPSFTQSFNLRLNNYISSHMQTMMAFVNFSTTSNSISNRVEYDATTGGRTTRPENINGNWDAGIGLMYNLSIDGDGKFNMNNFLNYKYQNHVAYLFANNETNKNTTRQNVISDRLSFSYRSALIDIEPNGSFTYTNSRNLLQSNANLNTWNFNYGLAVTLNLPWGTALTTDAGMNSRRGYADASLNTNEMIWNAQLSQSFLKGKPLTISLQFYDILHQQSNLSRVINATQRTDTQYNAIHSYAMLHVIFRFNKFGANVKLPGGIKPSDVNKALNSRGGDGPRPDFGSDRFRR